MKKMEKNDYSLPFHNPNPPLYFLHFLCGKPKTQTHKFCRIRRLCQSLNPKKVVLFRPPINPSLTKSTNVDDEDEEDSDEENYRKKGNAFDSINQAPSVKSFLSSIPTPKNSGSLGGLSSSAGLGRRSILEADVPSLNSNVVSTVNGPPKVHQVNYESFDVSSDYAVGADSSPNLGLGSEDYTNYVSYEDHDNYGGYGNVGGDPSSIVSASEDYANYRNYGGYENSGQYESKWVDRSGRSVEVEVSGATVENVVKVPGKRGRNEIPQEVIEVKQDELMKNRPREDQSKLTGIAFGPSYRPVSAKGKPSKLQKRKHQITSLYYDMRQKEMELAERHAKGLLSKAETQGKYGW